MSSLTAAPDTILLSFGIFLDEVAMSRVIRIALAAGLVVLVASALPDIKRYLRIRNM